jgi:glycosyltransferase involved in cell wall biosynthesis
MPDVSVITPSLNQGRFIEATIQSVLSQDAAGRELEYIVVDGGSRDSTRQILARYAGRLAWISEADRGQADAVNKGLSMTSGEVIGWVNSDDIYYPGALRVVCEFFDSHPDVDVVYGEANHIDADNLVLGRYPTEAFNPRRLLETCYLCQPAVFFRRRVVNRYGPLDATLHYTLDYEYWLRLSRGGAIFARLPEIVAGSRLYPGIKTYARRLEQHQEMNRMMRERLCRVPDQWIYNYAHARLERTTIDSGQHLRFALALTAFTAWASLRWNHDLPPSIRRTTVVWMKDGLKRAGWSLGAQVRARLP